jgi:hypothetical protein
VSIGFEFGLSDYHYSFVGINNFCDYSPSRHFVPRHSARNVYRNSTVINNYVVGNNNTVINRGVGRETIARNSSTRIREVSVRETQVQNLASVRGERVQRQGDQSVVYRPQLPKTPQVRTAQFANQPGRNSAVAVGRTSTSGTVAGNAQPTTVTRTENRANIDARPAAGANRQASRATATETRREQIGRGTSRDARANVSTLREAAAMGHQQAVLTLASRLENGAGMGRDYNESALWYTRAATSGSSLAMMKLADWARRGRGMTRDDALSVRYYRQAAEAGHPDGAWEAARAYLEGGRGVAADEATGMTLLRQAARLGNTSAIEELQRRGG